MPRISQAKIEKAQTTLKKKKVVTLDYLVSILDCSTPSARLKLKQWRTYNSYNQNGRYYTLPDVPKFDGNGLWKYKSVFFSKHGTLKNTVVHLINSSTSGLTGKQIGEIVGISPQSFLCHFRYAPGVRREKYDSLYVYFSDDHDRYKQQISSRLDAFTLSARHLSDADAVIILVAVIKHHNITVDNLALLPEIKTKNFSPLILREFFERHGLEKKAHNSKR